MMIDFSRNPTGKLIQYCPVWDKSFRFKVWRWLSHLGGIIDNIIGFLTFGFIQSRLSITLLFQRSD